MPGPPRCGAIKLESGGDFRHQDNAKIALFMVIVMMGFCRPPGEEASSFAKPDKIMPDLHTTGFLWTHVVVCANWVDVRSLGLQSPVKMQGLGKSLIVIPHPERSRSLNH